MADSEVQFPEGLRCSDGPEGSFVDIQIGIKKSEFIDWLNTQQGEWVNLDIKRSKEGNKPYARLNTYKRES